MHPAAAARTITARGGRYAMAATAAAAATAVAAGNDGHSQASEQGQGSSSLLSSRSPCKCEYSSYKSGNSSDDTNERFDNRALIRRNEIFATSSSMSSRFTHSPTSCYLFQPTKTEQDTLQSQKLDLHNEEARFVMALQKHQRLLEKYKEKWDYSKGAGVAANANSRTPTSSWPQDIPSDDEIPALLSEQQYCNRSPNYRDDTMYCQQVQFRIGAHYLLRTDDASGKIQKAGLNMMKDLAERGHPDAMCLYGQILNEGRAGLDPNPIQGVVWLRRCAELHHHSQAIYELGVAFYTGEGVIENESEAVKYFRLASDKGHPGASYLLGDCLLDGFGVERDRAEALERLIEAAERGHRGARSRVLAVLEHKEGHDFGLFTDGSRQTLVSSTPMMKHYGGSSASNTKLKISSPTQDNLPAAVIRMERRFTIGGEPADRGFIVGGVPPPATIARRKTQVGESRNI
jgi:TPR repeat protein